ncbi:MAG: hypothetical protein J5898_11895 [Lachnospiraceae bacterium]|nr:hypothetical protein [Lachnospiraceae bacterium]
MEQGRETEKSRKIEVLINPGASSGRGSRIWKSIRPIMQEKGVSFREHLLKAPGEATALTERLTANPEGDCHILVIGGDGTLNEVLNGIRDFEHTRLSCIRSGSGNDFARNMNVEKSPEEALKHLLEEPEEIRLDYGEIETGEHDKKRFLISCGVGYDADICAEASGSRLKKVMNRIGLGKLVYALIGIRQIFTRNSTEAVLYMDDREPVRISSLFFVVGMNHVCEGGGVPFCPTADPTDGFLDVCLVRDMPKWKLMLGVALVYMKKHELLRNITCYRCKTMRLVAQKPQQIHLDGETPYQVQEILWISKGKFRFVK